MKSFLEEYGIVVVVAIVILALIGVAIFFRGEGVNSIEGQLNNFLSAANE